MASEPNDQEHNSIALFEAKSVRRVWHKNTWYFSIIDVIEILTDSPNPRNYWSMLKRKLKAEGAGQLYTNSVQLKMQSSDGKKYLTDAADTETLLRIMHNLYILTIRRIYCIL